MYWVNIEKNRIEIANVFDTRQNPKTIQEKKINKANRQQLGFREACKAKHETNVARKRKLSSSVTFLWGLSQDFLKETRGPISLKSKSYE